MSKIVTAQVCLDAGIGPDTAMTEALDWPLAHPGHPETRITAGMVAAHHAGLSDEAGLVPPEGDLRRFCASPGVWAAAPGTTFSYSNFAYVLLAAAAEATTGRRFGDLTRDWLDARGIGGGFNFWGVDPADRARALPCRRPIQGGWNETIDGAVDPDGLIGPDGRRRHAPDPGEAPWAWSPQGGLRLTLADALRLAQAVGGLDATPIWRAGQGPVDGPEAVYQSWGYGLQLLDHPPHWPRPLVGHFGDAYGIRTGVWHDPATGTSFAYFLNGVAERTGPDADDFNEDERRILVAVADEAA